MNITNTTKEVTDEMRNDTSIIIIIIVFVIIIGYCVICNRDKKKDIQDMERRSTRAEQRLEIRNGN
jgi:heme/copper-type cytochrome/quinol oxidase subunit 2